MSDTEHDISLRNMREERDREINNEKDSFYQPRDNFHEPNYERENFHDYDYDRDNFQQPNFGNNEYRYQWSNNDNYKGFNSNQEREYAKNGEYFQRNSRQQNELTIREIGILTLTKNTWNNYKNKLKIYT